MADSDRPETFGDRVRAARHQLSADRRKTVDQKQLAELLGVSPATVSSWETGGKEPSFGTVARIATALGVRAAWLAFGEEPMRDEGSGGSAAPIPRVPSPVLDPPLAAFTPVKRPAKKPTRRRA